MRYLTVGTDRPIHDAAGKVSGSTKYAADLCLPGMAYVALVRSTVPHGNVKAVHAEDALAVPGVFGVFDCFNTTGRTFNRYRCNFDQDRLADEERVFTDYVRFVGDRVAAVAAADQATAERAARLVRVEYEALPFSLGFDDTLAGKNCLAGEQPIKDEFDVSFGDAPQDASLIRVESRCELPRLHHAAMEPHVCVADYDPYAEFMTIYSPNQSVHGIRQVVAGLLELPQSRVRVVKTAMGGSFGGKQEWETEPVAALVAKLLGRPVKFVFSRAEAMTCSVTRAAIRTKIIGYYAPDGKLRSLDVDVLHDAGAYIGNSFDYVRTMYGKLFRCYAMEHIHYHSRVISSNTPVSGAFRGWSSPEEATVLEHHLDDAAAALRLDRVALRLRNAIRPFATDQKTGLPLEDIRIRDALLQGRAAFDWEKRKQENREFNASQPRFRRGIGVGCGGHGNTYYPVFGDYCQAQMSVNADGSVQLSVSLHDHGCGAVTMVKMVAAEVLTIPEDRIFVAEADTARTPIDFGCYASRTTYIVGRTVQLAAEALRGELFDCCEKLFAVPKDRLFLENGAVKMEGSEAFCQSVQAVACGCMKQFRRNLSVDYQYQNQGNPGVTGAHFALVEVDTYTGLTRVLDYLAVHDIGQPINAGMCVAQIQGAAQMGCGAALREKLDIQPDGRCTQSLAQYHVFLASELPEIKTMLLTEGKSEEGPFGAKSIGEVAFVPAAAAVCGAVNDALGASIERLPYDAACIVNYLEGEAGR